MRLKWIINLQFPTLLYRQVNLGRDGSARVAADRPKINFILKVQTKL